MASGFVIESLNNNSMSQKEVKYTKKDKGTSYTGARTRKETIMD